MYRIVAEQFLPVSQEEAWAFFSAPKNLAMITPPDFDFIVLSSHADQEIYAGMIIDYTIRPLFGIQMHWQTEIREVQKNTLFTDVQAKGPYKVWEHTHYFTEQEGGVLMRDEVVYALPLGFLGKLVHWLVVRRRLKQLFDYRRTAIAKLFVHPG